MTRSTSRPFALMTALFACLLASPASAQSLDLTQYAHTAWKSDAWITDAFISTLVQSKDGFLWCATNVGVYRFDGVRFTKWEPPSGEKLPADNILDLIITRDGTIWIATAKGLVSWRNGKLMRYTETSVTSRMLERADGTIWFGLSTRGLCNVRGETVSCVGDRPKRGESPRYLAEDRTGVLSVWTGSAILRWEPGGPRRYTLPDGAKPLGVVADDDGAWLILGDDYRLWSMVGETIKRYPEKDLGPSFPLTWQTPDELHPTTVFKSRDGAIWLGTYQGIVHVHDGRTDRFTVADGLSGGSILGFFEDREGNVWVNTWEGLDLFRRTPVQTITQRQGLSSSTVWAVQASPSGDVWISTAGGLNRVPAGTTTVMQTELRGPVYALGLDAHGQLLASTPSGLVTERGGRFSLVSGTPERPVVAIATDANGRIWMSTARGELFRRELGSKLQAVRIEAKANPTVSQFDLVQAFAPDRDRGLWLGFKGLAAAYLRETAVTTASVNPDYRKFFTSANQIRLGSDGWLWAASGSGVGRIKAGEGMMLTALNGLPGFHVEWTVEDAGHALWISLVNGLARIDRAEWEAWTSDPKRRVKVTLLTSEEGVRKFEVGRALSPPVTTSADGRIWFVVADGVGVFDPNHLTLGSPPLPPQFEQISADGRSERLPTNTPGPIHLAPLVRNLEIEFTAPVFTAPEKVRFRFKLDGQDPDWREVVNQRRAAYSNLAPGPYRFRVMAANASGVWSDTTILEFDVAPALYQRRAFVPAMVTLGLLLVGLTYRFRVRHVSRRLSRRFDERLDERTRVARELHDTFLQTVTGSRVVVDHALTNRADHDGVVRAMEQVSQWLRQATDEARSALNSLRASTKGTTDLAEAFRRAVDECGVTSRADISLSVEGDGREMHQVVSEEVYRIGYEAIRNACTHSTGNRIAISLEYGRDLTLRVSDNGTGIDPVIAETGKDRHFGLRGMKERAQRINARLNIVSSPEAGTAITVVVPDRVAFRGVMRPADSGLRSHTR